MVFNLMTIQQMLLGTASGGGGLFAFNDFTFTSPDETPFAPSSTDIKNQSGYSVGANPWINDTNFFQVLQGIQYFTIPEDGSYRITAAGASAQLPPNGAGQTQPGSSGRGAKMRGTFTLSSGTIIGILVGHRNPLAYPGGGVQYGYPEWAGGAGGTFVVKLAGLSASNTSHTLSTTLPLLVAGGASSSRNSTVTGCDGSMSCDGRLGTGNAPGYNGEKAVAYGHNQNGGSGACGWKDEVGADHGDTRSPLGSTPTGYAGLLNPGAGARGFQTSSNPARGGIFISGYTDPTNESGGFGCGGAGGWGGQGGGGGYSGGANDGNNGHGGGGGSFIASTASNAGTSDGTWSVGNGTFSGHSALASNNSLPSIGWHTSGNGFVLLEKL